MDRRTALRAFLGAASLAAGSSILLPRSAEALPGASPLPPLDVTPTPAVATEADVAAAHVENVQYWGGRRRHWGGPHWGWRRRHWGGPPPWWRRRRYWGGGPGWRRCWINRFGERVCRM
jgi:hypothetical protein